MHPLPGRHRRLHQRAVVVVVMARHAVRHIVGRQRLDERIQVLLLGHQLGEQRQVGRRHRIGVHPKSVARIGRRQVPVKQVVLVVAAQQVLVREHHRVRRPRPVGQLPAEPRQLRRDRAVIVVAIDIKLIQQHEPHVVIVEAVRHAVVRRVHRHGRREVRPDHERRAALHRRGVAVPGGQDRRRDIRRRIVIQAAPNLREGVPQLRPRGQVRHQLRRLVVAPQRVEPDARVVQVLRVQRPRANIGPAPHVHRVPHRHHQLHPLGDELRIHLLDDVRRARVRVLPVIRLRPLRVR